MTGANVCLFGEVLFDHFPGRRAGSRRCAVQCRLAPAGVWPDPPYSSAVSVPIPRRTDPPIHAKTGAWTSTACRPTHLPTGRVSARDGEPATTSSTLRLRCHRSPPDPTPGPLLYHGSLALRSRSRSCRCRAAWRQPAHVFRRCQSAPALVAHNRQGTFCAGTGRLGQAEHRRARVAAGGHPTFARQGFLVHDLLRAGTDSRCRGAQILTAGGRNSVRRLTRIRVVDTVGAGDAFASVVITRPGQWTGHARR